MSDSIGTAQLFSTPQEWHDDIGADAVEARVGLVSVDEELPGITPSVSNANNVWHRLGAASDVRHDGSGSNTGARLLRNNAHVVLLQTNNFIIEDLRIQYTGNLGNRHCVNWNANGDRTIIRRCTIINTGTASNSSCMSGITGMDDVEIYLNHFFRNRAGVLVVQLGISGLNCKLICNTIVQDGAIEMGSGFNVKPGTGWVAHGNYVHARLITGSEYLNTPTTSQKNAGEDGSAWAVDPIDLTDDLGLDWDDMIVSDLLASIDLRRVAANHGGAAQEVGVDLEALGIPGIDVTGAAFDNTNPHFGAHQVAVLPSGLPEGIPKDFKFGGWGLNFDGTHG